MITIPQTALNHRPTEGDYVWTVDNAAGKVSKRKIVLGELLPNGKVEVKGGLQAGETVAVSKLRFLSEGTSVEIMAQKQGMAGQLLKSKFESIESLMKYFLQKRSVDYSALTISLRRRTTFLYQNGKAGRCSVHYKTGIGINSISGCFSFRSTITSD